LIEKYRGQNIGKNIVKFALDDGRKDRGLKHEDACFDIFSPDLFLSKMGFTEIPKETIPEHKDLGQTV